MKAGKFTLLAFLCFFLFEFGLGDDAGHAFAGDFLKTLYDDSNRQDNTVVSPLSLGTLLGLLEQGSVGETQEDLTRVLYADPETTRQQYRTLTAQLQSPHNGTTLEISNKIYLENGFNIQPGFRNVAVEDFGADIENIEFRNAVSAADIINKWVSDNTHGRITELVTPDSISPDSEAMLLNAIYFNGQWKHKFDENGTVNRSFITMSGMESMAPMMHLRDKLVAGELTDIGAKYVSLPFEDENFKMIVVVPDKVDKLGDVINKLQEDKLESVLGGSVRTVDLRMPKFKFSITSKLVPILKSMGLERMFSSAANFSRIASSPPLKVSGVVQKAEIEVDEKGATASAVTGITLVATSAVIGPPPEVLVIDAKHPFLTFIIFGSASWPLFACWVGDPSIH